MTYTLINVQRDTHCYVCNVDTTETVVDDRCDVVFVEMSCCGERVEYLHSDFSDLIDGE